MQGDEIRALRRLQREQGLSSHVFMTERDGPMTPKAFHALFGRIGARAKMPFPIHPHRRQTVKARPWRRDSLTVSRPSALSAESIFRSGKSNVGVPVPARRAERLF